MTGNYKNNLVIQKICRRADWISLFQKPEHPFFLGRRFLPEGDGTLGRRQPDIGFIFFLHVLCNQREMGIPFLGDRNLLVGTGRLFRDYRSRKHQRAGNRRFVVPGFPVRIRDDHRRQGHGRFSLGNDNRRLSRMGCLRLSLPVERCPAAVAEDRLAAGIGRSA